GFLNRVSGVRVSPGAPDKLKASGIFSGSFFVGRRRDTVLLYALFQRSSRTFPSDVERRVVCASDR
ncbi:MAG TPA: hypothetical protein DCD97_05655, partial [Firmicutes bacterium]|nr:hypothetical protein [Bacillota bacterium]